MRLVGLYVFFYTQFVRKDNFMVGRHCGLLVSLSCVQCWESYVGQQIYEVYIVTFIFELVTSIIVNPLKVFFNKYTECYGKVRHMLVAHDTCDGWPFRF